MAGGAPPGGVWVRRSAGLRDGGHPSASSRRRATCMPPAEPDPAAAPPTDDHDASVRVPPPWPSCKQFANRIDDTGQH